MKTIYVPGKGGKITIPSDAQPLAEGYKFEKITEQKQVILPAGTLVYYPQVITSASEQG